MDYIPHDAQRVAPHVPESYQKPQGDFDLLTSYTKDYPARKVELSKSFRATHSNHVPTGEFRGHPTYTGMMLHLCVCGEGVGWGMGSLAVSSPGLTKLPFRKKFSLREGEVTRKPKVYDKARDQEITVLKVLVQSKIHADKLL